MRAMAVAWVLWRDHVRRGAILTELALVGITIAVLFDPRNAPYELEYGGMVCGLVACFLSAVTTSVLTARAADMRGEALLLTAGRIRYFLAVCLASAGITLLWTGVLIGAYLTIGGGSPGGAPFPAVAAIVLNVLITVAAFSTFSVLCGSHLQIVLPITLVIVGLNPPEAGLPAWLLPPLLPNIWGAMGTGSPVPLPSLVYTLALAALGVFRFSRRELFWR